jgi:hypothetical protein
MNKLSVVPPSEEAAFAYSLGFVIWSMGQVEYLAIEWARILGGDAAKDKAITQTGFGGRLKVVIGLLESRALAPHQLSRYRRLWRKAKGFSKFRNVVAHNPVITMKLDRSAGFGVADARSLIGSGRRGVRVWFAPKLYQVALKMRELVLQLDACLLELDALPKPA